MKNSKLTLVLMAGLPGTGKSTLARTLGHGLGWHVIDKDRHKAVLMKQGLEDDRAGKVSYELAFDTAHTVLVELRTSVILDSAALHRFILENSLTIVRDVQNAQLKVIFCVADRDLRNERLRNRPWQQATIRVDPETIADYLQHFKHLPSDKLTLYTIKPFEECLAAAREYLTN